MLHIAVEALGAVTKYCEVATYAALLSYTNVWEVTIFPSASSVVGKMHAERRPFRGRVMREVTGFSRAGAVAMQKVPADGNLVRVMLVHASQTTAAGTCSCEAWAGFVQVFHALISALLRTSSII
jgi:hypothetical protein